MAVKHIQRRQWLQGMGFLAAMALALYMLSGAASRSSLSSKPAQTQLQQPPTPIAVLRRQAQGTQQQQLQEQQQTKHRQQKQQTEQQAKQRLLVDIPLPALPPFEPTCRVRFDYREGLGCRPFNCSLAEACSMADTSCCAYFNQQMLGDLQGLLHAKGLQGEYAAVYGTALGAERDQAVMGHTHDVDIAFTPTAVQVLAQNATREQLWRQGYVLWYDRYQWCMCPHDLHPAPEFRAAMVAKMTHKQWQKQAGTASGVYTDVYLMYPLPEGGSCAEKSVDVEAAIMLQPTQLPESLSGVAADSRPDMPGSWQQQHGDGDSAARTRRFCLQLSNQSVEIRAGGRQARVGGVNLTTLENLEEHLVTAYGEGWRVPDLSYHGFTKHPADFRSVERALLARLAVTAWGNVTGAEREARCNARKKQSTAPPQTKQSSAPPPPPSPPGLAVKQGSQQNDQKKLAASRPDGAMRGRRLVSATQPSMS